MFSEGNIYGLSDNINNINKNINNLTNNNLLYYKNISMLFIIL